MNIHTTPNRQIMTTLMIIYLKNDAINSKLKRCPAIRPIVAAAALFGSPVAFAHVRVAGSRAVCEWPHATPQGSDSIAELGFLKLSPPQKFGTYESHWFIPMI